MLRGPDGSASGPDCRLTSVALPERGGRWGEGGEVGAVRCRRQECEVVVGCPAESVQNPASSESLEENLSKPDIEILELVTYRQ